MTSHEYALKLRKAAEFFESRPEFVINARPLLYASYWNDKESFLAAVKSLGKGKKEYTETELKFTVPIIDDVSFDIDINRSAVCRLVRPAEYECVPLLSQEEEASLGAA